MSRSGRQEEPVAREMLAKLLGIFEGKGECSEHVYEWIDASQVNVLCFLA